MLWWWWWWLLLLLVVVVVLLLPHSHSLRTHRCPGEVDMWEGEQPDVERSHVPVQGARLDEAHCKRLAGMLRGGLQGDHSGGGDHADAGLDETHCAKGCKAVQLVQILIHLYQNIYMGDVCTTFESHFQQGLSKTTIINHIHRTAVKIRAARRRRRGRKSWQSKTHRRR